MIPRSRRPPHRFAAQVRVRRCSTAAKKRRHRDELWCVAASQLSASKDALTGWSKAVLTLILWPGGSAPEHA